MFGKIIGQIYMILLKITKEEKITHYYQILKIMMKIFFQSLKNYNKKLNLVEIV